MWLKTLLFTFIQLALFFSYTIAQNPKQNLVYVDNKGVLRYTATKKEATFFGVNYTVPFAYGYRSHKALGIDPEKAIDADVAHMARLGLNAFRVHVWDVEISDSLGNLLENEHLRLFDYLLFKLKQQNIKILITPIAFWGSGYPEPDIKTIGFASVYGKGPSVVREEAIKAQENYLKQFFSHVNPYTKTTYRDDVDVIAMEINNEPHHSGPREKTTEYVNRMAASVRSTGWTKPIFYNISESPSYAGPVTAAKVDGFSFQWYPTGLVANHERRGNFLPNVDRYHIPFLDSLPAFAKGARIVYEFDAGDVMQPIMYPAMARSYRTAGFQWATQFAYDPLYTAYGNTEYQTHYLNLVYTPSKAISLLIAAKAFHRVPRGKSYGRYPADTLFDAFRVSYRDQLSEMNTDEEFYYTSSTATQPKAGARLKHIAGVGSSQIVQYEGTGTYFLDKVADGAWRLEVFPDAVVVADPFEKASPQKTVTRIQWRANRMKILLFELNEQYAITGATTGNKYKSNWSREGNYLRPGVYFITGPQSAYAGYTTSGVEFYAPPSTTADPVVYHQPVNQVSAQQTFSIAATIAGMDTADKVSVEIRHSEKGWKTVPMQRAGYTYTAAVPLDLASPGLINYRMMVRKANGDTYTFPGGFKGNPYAWDEYRNESWQTEVAAPDSYLSLFHPAKDRAKLMLYNPDWRANTIAYVTSGKTSDLVMRANMTKPVAGQRMGFQSYFLDELAGRISEVSSFTKLVVRARASENTSAKISLITTDADAYGTAINLSPEWKELEIPLSSLQSTSFLLLPRPYPGFQPLEFQSANSSPFAVTDIERLELSIGPIAQPVQWEIGGVWLAK
ncbi:cellulase family glycosylhydrolase [Flavisolibacter sp. BT320]|nr:cellulase family glycosylhydrolase [Flavisolibacter longurius]